MVNSVEWWDEFGLAAKLKTFKQSATGVRGWALEFSLIEDFNFCFSMCIKKKKLNKQNYFYFLIPSSYLEFGVPV